MASEKEVFYGGEAGGGKSAALLIDAVEQVPIPRYRAIIFRRIYRDLKGLIETARQWYCATGATYNESKHIFTWLNGSTVEFSHMQHVKDIYSHQGQEYDYIAFDELPQFPKVAYVYLFSRLRGTNPKIRRYMRSTGNPDGPFLMWVKARFHDPMEPGTRAYFKTVSDKDVKVDENTPGAISRRFIPCIRAENRILMDNDPDYENALDQLPEAQKRALKEGLWTMQDKPDQLISGEWWDNAVNGKNEFKNDGKYTIGADFATYQGTDKSVEFLGIGNRPYRCRSWPKTKAPEFAMILAETAANVDRSNTMIGVDSIGPGCGVADDLEMHHNCSDILDRCNHKDPRFDAKYLGEIQFDNLRSQMCWKFRKDMENGEIDLSEFTRKKDKDTDHGYFDDFGTLQEEVYAHTFRVYNGKLIVISKEELRKPENLGRSPDFFDALVIWNWTRRHHLDREVDIDAQYHIDKYADAMFDDDQDDDLSYYASEYDEAEYDD